MKTIQSALLRVSQLFIYCLILHVNAYSWHIAHPISKADSLVALANKATNPAVKLGVLIKLSSLNFELSAFEVVKYGKEALSISQSLNNVESEVQALLNIGIGYQHLGNFDEAFEYFLDALNKADHFHNENLRIKILLNTGLVYWKIEDYDRAQPYYNTALERIESVDDTLIISSTYNLVGLNYMSRARYDSALFYFEKSLDMDRQIDNKAGIARAYNNIGIVYQFIGKYDQAKNYYQACLKIHQEQQETWGIIETLNNLGSISIETNDFDQAEEKLKVALKMLNDFEDLNLRKDNYSYFVKLYKVQNKYAMAFDFSERRDSLLASMRRDELADLRNINKLEKQQSELTLKAKELEILTEKKKISDLKSRALISSIIVLCLIGFLLYRKFRNDQKTKKLLYENELAIMAEQSKIAELQRQQLDEKLAFKNQRLTDFALHISQKQSIYKAFKEDLEEIEFMNKLDASTKIQKLIREFNTKLLVNSKLEEMQTQAELINDDFFFAMQKELPTLTENERNLASLLRLNLSSKEIAIMTNISVKSVEINRHRLRKKLGLDAEETLSDFFQKI